MDALQKIRIKERYFRDPVVGDGILRPPASGEACHNIRSALRLLNYKVASGDRYDNELEAAVLAFQTDYKHTSLDGYVGPGTRRLLTKKLLEKRGEQPFRRMTLPKGNQPPLVFLSYAWEDAKRVDKIDQWLRDHGIRVERDMRDFIPGKKLPQEITDAIARADKVIAIYSFKSRERDWPRFEINIAEQHEKNKKRDLLIYVVLDDAPLPKHDPHRIAVMAKDRTLGDVGKDLLRGIVGPKGKPLRYNYNENEAL